MGKPTGIAGAALVALLTVCGPARAEMVIINGVPYDSKKKEGASQPSLATPVEKSDARYGAPSETAPVINAGPAPTVSVPAQNNPDPVSDSALRIKKVFLFPAWDDMNGVLAPQLDQKLADLFAHQPRFNLVRDPQVIKALAPDDASYGKAAESPAVHREAARATGADTTALLRTRNVGSQTEMTLELRDSQGSLLFSESGTIPGYSSMAARDGLVESLFRAVLAKIPFDGTITGRTANLLTLDLGAGAVQVGQEVDLARIVSFQRHPLLHTIVGTDYVKTGKARITSVDKALSFAEITEEYSGESIRAGQKVLISKASLVRRPDPSNSYAGVGERGRKQDRPGKDMFDDRLKGDFDRNKPRFGTVGLNLGYGSLSHSETNQGNVTDLAGSGVGGSLDGELWVTKEWIVNAYYGFQNAGLSGTGIDAGSSSWKKFELAGGYRFFPDALGDGAEVTGEVGYQTQNFHIPTPFGTAISGKSYNGLVLKLDGSMQFLPNQKATLGFAFQPFSSFHDEGASIGNSNGGNVVSFHLAWHYRFADNFWAKVGIEFDTANGNYDNGNSASDKRFAIGPGIYYSF